MSDDAEHVATARISSLISPDSLRRQCDDMVARDLMGPAGGPDEALNGNERVLARYLVGMLAPKKSTATVRRAREQVWGIFWRDLAVFPPPVLDAGDSFFARERRCRSCRRRAARGTPADVYRTGSAAVESRHATDALMRCERCLQGDRRPVTRAKLAEKSGRVAVVLGVPMEEGEAWGERWLSWDVARRLDELLTEMLDEDTAVSARQYESARTAG